MITPLPEGSVLDAVVHARLIADLEGVCATANIPKACLHQSAKAVCSPEELEWVRNFATYREEGKGLVIVGDTSIGPDTRMWAIGAALLRNFIDARMMMLNAVLEGADDGAALEPTVMLVPNLYVQSFGKPLTAWQVQKLYDVLLSRLAKNRLTVAYVESMDGVRDVYGAQIANHLLQHFKIVTHKH